LATPSEHPQDRVEDCVQFLANILGEKAQHDVAVLLEELVLASIATIGRGVVVYTLVTRHVLRNASVDVDAHDIVNQLVLAEIDVHGGYGEEDCLACTSLRL
jgi:hypothetical protein